MENELRDYELTELGKIRIAPQVIEVISKLSTLEIEGVSSLSGRLTGELAGILGRNKHTTNGIKVEVGEKETAVDVSVVLKYGYSIPETAEKIQDNVKYAIESMTNLRVVEVNVHVNGVQFEDKPEEEPRLK